MFPIVPEIVKYKLLNPLPIRFPLCLSLISEKHSSIYLIGGHNKNKTYKFNYKTNKYKKLKEMPMLNPSEHSGCFMNDKKTLIITIGFCRQNDTHNLDLNRNTFICIYDIIKNKWELFPNSNSFLKMIKKHPYWLCGIRMCYYNNVVHIIGRFGYVQFNTINHNFKLNIDSNWKFKPQIEHHQIFINHQNKVLYIFSIKVLDLPVLFF